MCQQEWPLKDTISFPSNRKRVNIPFVKMDKQKAIKIGVGLAFCLLTFLGGYWIATSQMEAQQKLRLELVHKNPQKRVAALKKAQEGILHPPPEMLMKRMTDKHHFVSGSAAETVYRMGLGKKLTGEVVANLMKRLDKETEYTQRWLIANIIAFEYEAGFELAAQHLPKMTSPWSKPFFVRLLVIHGENTAKVKNILANLEKRGEPYKSLVKAVREKLAIPANKRWSSFTDFLPPSLQVKKVPRPPAEL